MQAMIVVNASYDCNTNRVSYPKEVNLDSSDIMIL